MRIFLFALFAFSYPVFSHGHWPQKIEGYSIDEVYEVKFELSNHFKKRTCFDIEINGKIYSPYRTCLRQKQKKNISVWVKTEPDVQTRNVVCSISDDKDKVRTRMCSDVITYWPKSLL